MPRWMAICKAPADWGDIKKFGQQMHETHNWRPDARTTITTVWALTDGRVVAECHGVEQKDFEAWLKSRNLTIESVTPIKHLSNVGSIWDGQKP